LEVALMRTSAVLVLTLAVAVAGCGSHGEPVSNPGVTIDVDEAFDEASGVVGFFPPGGTAPSVSDPPLIVLVPGGGWETADPAGMVPLAEALAHRGAMVATTTYRAADVGVLFPAQAEDVACAIAEAAEQSRIAGHAPGEVVVVGHSAGAHLGAIVTLDPDRFLAGCEHPPIRPGRFIGLAGPYDIVRAGPAADAMFGTATRDPELLAAANPVEFVGSRPEVAVLLVHGRSDTTVPVSFTESFAAALLAAGHAVTTVYPEGVDHHSIYSSDVADALIAEWLDL
jgi:acetyl esterase/lipase